MLARQVILGRLDLPETLDQLDHRGKQDFKVRREFKAQLESKAFKGRLAFVERPAMRDLQERLVELAPKVTMDPLDLPVLGERLALLATQEKPDPKDLRELGRLAQQVYQDLREVLDPKVRLALLELRAQLVKLACPAMLEKLDRLETWE